MSKCHPYDPQSSHYRLGKDREEGGEEVDEEDQRCDKSVTSTTLIITS